MRAHRRGRPARRHHGATRAGLELLAGLCVVGLLLASPLVALWWWESHLSTPGHHETVTLGAAACASVRSIQSAAQGFWNEWVAVQSDPRSWNARRARLLRATDAFDATLERDAPPFPAPLRRQLQAVQRQVHEGRRLIGAASGFYDWWSHDSTGFGVGTHAYGNAVTLVGSSCDGLWLVTPGSADPYLAHVFAGLANWVCGGPTRPRCATTTTRG